MIDMVTKIHHSGKGCPLGMMMFSEACIADDIGMVSTTMDGLASLLSIVVEEGARTAEKSRVMLLQHDKHDQIRSMPMELETVEMYKYLCDKLGARPTATFYKHFEEA
mgnify:CR=1 FL=1